MSDDLHADVLGLTAKIVVAHFTRNKVAAGRIDPLIRAVYQSLANASEDPPLSKRPVPAVPAKRSIFPDFLICLEDGKEFKVLKGHLRSKYNLSPAEYRLKWNLPENYPMVAPNYSKRRSDLARTIGLRRTRTDVSGT